MTYNRPAEVNSGGDSGLGPARPGGPDPRYPQLPPGVPVPGKNFAPRPELIAKGFRGGDEVRIGPGSEQWTRGADAVLNKRSLSLGQVAGPRRKPR
jgi:hypothetical protein